MTTTNPLEAVSENWNDLVENYENDVIDITPMTTEEISKEDTKTYQDRHFNKNEHGLTGKQATAVNNAKLAVNELIKTGLLQWWLETKLIPAQKEAVKAAWDSANKGV